MNKREMTPEERRKELSDAISRDRAKEQKALKKMGRKIAAYDQKIKSNVNRGLEAIAKRKAGWQEQSTQQEEHKEEPHLRQDEREKQDKKRSVADAPDDTEGSKEEKGNDGQ